MKSLSPLVSKIGLGLSGIAAGYVMVCAAAVGFRPTFSVNAACASGSEANRETQLDDCVYSPSLVERLASPFSFFEHVGDALFGDAVSVDQLGNLSTACNGLACPNIGKVVSVGRLGIAGITGPINQLDFVVQKESAQTEGGITRYNSSGHTSQGDIAHLSLSSGTGTLEIVSSDMTRPSRMVFRLRKGAAGWVATRETLESCHGEKGACELLLFDCPRNNYGQSPPNEAGGTGQTLRVRVAVSNQSLALKARTDDQLTDFLTDLETMRRRLLDLAYPISGTRFDISFDFGLTDASGLSVLADYKPSPLNVRRLAQLGALRQTGGFSGGEVAATTCNSFPTCFETTPLPRDYGWGSLANDILDHFDASRQNQSKCARNSRLPFCQYVSQIKAKLNADVLIFVIPENPLDGQGKIAPTYAGQVSNIGLDKKYANVAYVWDSALYSVPGHEFAHLLGSQHTEDPAQMSWETPISSSEQAKTARAIAPNRPFLMQLEWGSWGAKRCSIVSDTSCEMKWVGTVGATALAVGQNTVPVYNALSSPNSMCGRIALGNNSSFQDQVAVAEDVLSRYFEGGGALQYETLRQEISGHCPPFVAGDEGSAGLDPSEAVRLFSVGSWTVVEPTLGGEQTRKTKEALANTLASVKDPKSRVVLSAFADERGSVEYNLVLAHRRFEEVVNELCAENSADCRPKVSSCLFGKEVLPFPRAGDTYRRAVYARVYESR